MKIIVVCGAGYVSGKEKIMLSLLKGFAKDQHDVFCITSTWGNGQFEELLECEKINYAKLRIGFISKTFTLSALKMTMHQILYLPKLLYNYAKIIRRFKPDVIIHSNFHHLFLLYPVIKANGALNIYHNHESIGDTKFYKGLFGLFNKKIALFISVSEYVTGRLRKLGIPEHKLRTIHNGLEIVEYPPVSLGKDNVINIGVVGQVGGWKGHEDLVLSLEILTKEGFTGQFKLSIFGTGDIVFLNELKDLIKQKGLEKFVEWEGFKKSLNEIYASLQLVCVPSRSEEPFATSVLEAGLFALPVIVTGKGGFPEMVAHGYNGFIVNANSPEEIAHYLRLLILDPNLLIKMGLNHRQTIYKNFSFPVFIAKWESMLSALTLKATAFDRIQ